MSFLMLCMKETKKKIIEMIDESPILVNAKDNDGDTALIWACIEGHIDVVELLLNHGANVDETNQDGDTALIWASSEGFSDIVELLMMHGPDITIANKEGHTAFSAAHRQGHSKIAAVLRTQYRPNSINAVPVDVPVQAHPQHSFTSASSSPVPSQPFIFGGPPPTQPATKVAASSSSSPSQPIIFDGTPHQSRNSCQYTFAACAPNSISSTAPAFVFGGDTTTTSAKPTPPPVSGAPNALTPFAVPSGMPSWTPAFPPRRRQVAENVKSSVSNNTSTVMVEPLPSASRRKVKVKSYKSPVSSPQPAAKFIAEAIASKSAASSSSSPSQPIIFGGTPHQSRNSCQYTFAACAPNSISSTAPAFVFGGDTTTTSAKPTPPPVSGAVPSGMPSWTPAFPPRRRQVAENVKSSVSNNIFGAAALSLSAANTCASSPSINATQPATKFIASSSSSSSPSQPIIFDGTPHQSMSSCQYTFAACAPNSISSTAPAFVFGGDTTTTSAKPTPPPVSGAVPSGMPSWTPAFPPRRRQVAENVKSSVSNNTSTVMVEPLPCASRRKVKVKSYKSPVGSPQQQSHTMLSASTSDLSRKLCVPAATPFVDEKNSESLKLPPIPFIDRQDIVVDMSSRAFAYRGRYRGTEVTIKMLRKHPDHATKTIFWEQEEIVMLSRLHHPRILTIFGIALDLDHRLDADCGLVFEHMSRGSLYEILHSVQLPQACRLTTTLAKLRVLRDVAEGMRFLHESNVVHRNLTSHKVLIDEEGRAKISEFGLSRTLDASLNGDSEFPAWQAPETLERTAEINFFSDTYSYGVILWEVTTGQVPWNNYDTTQMMTAILQEKQRLELPPVTPSCPASMIQLMKDCFGVAECRPNFPVILLTFKELIDMEQKRRQKVIPDDYICPITFEIMENPVICHDGHTYERAAIEDWLELHGTSPLTNMPLQSRELIPNIALRGAIRHFLEQQEKYTLPN